jgi:hypothetical protein
MKKNKWQIIAVISVVAIFIVALIDLFRGNLSFWYDPARDFLSAWDNLHKVTLIGPTTGIAGLFYGPYWIWLISFGMLFSKDPRFVISLILTIPYFVLFPYILFKFKKVYHWSILISLWVLFALHFGRFYATQPWNPHLAPLLFLYLFYLLLFIDYDQKGKLIVLKTFLTGIISGLLINFHVSFGVCVFLGSCLFFTITPFIQKNQKKFVLINYSRHLLKMISLFIFGIFVTFIPFFLFEVRHGFMQSLTLIKIFTSNSPVPGVTGMTKMQTIQEFFLRLSNFIHLPFTLSSISIMIVLLYFIYKVINKKITLNLLEKKMILLLFCFIFSIFFIYLSAKNPIWSYHFIGVEIVLLFGIGLLFNKYTFLRVIISGWAFFLVLSSLYTFIISLRSNSLETSSLSTKEFIVRQIITDGITNNYTVFAYSPSIYMYEYSYLFKWIGNKDIPYDPGQISSGSRLIYLIIPKLKQTEYNDFISYRSPEKGYKTTKRWKIPDGTVILKREKI